MLLIPKVAMARCVKAALAEFGDYRMSAEALALIHEMSESVVSSWMEMLYISEIYPTEQ